MLLLGRWKAPWWWLVRLRAASLASRCRGRFECDLYPSAAAAGAAAVAADAAVVAFGSTLTFAAAVVADVVAGVAAAAAAAVPRPIYLPKVLDEDSAYLFEVDAIA